ncbi:MAG: NADH:ubiquinone reductase (Na(+)-transporting) subunit C [Bacteroidetes bacterium]|nr:MAG: NADH:ubiquinone reductase (Na(+)-transporting) subunit C [Bacteroidota bacterium]
MLTLVCGTLLAFVSEGLKDLQKAAMLLEKQQFILKAGLGADGLEGLSGPEVTELYNKIVKVEIINSSGEKVDADEAKLSVYKEYKKEDASTRALPVYVVGKKDNPSEVESYVLPTYGNGLWDNVWAYVAIDGDLETIEGIVFDHKAETPGLGARITDPEVQSRFAGKKLSYEVNGINAPDFQKGEGNDFTSSTNKVDGLSGATITAMGVNDMLDAYLTLYKPYLMSKKKK